MALRNKKNGNICTLIFVCFLCVGTTIRTRREIHCLLYARIFSRPGQSQGLLYKQLGDSLINSLPDPLVSHSFTAPPLPNG